MHSTVPVLSDYHFQNLLEDTKPYIIYFFAPWCTHCQTFAPEFEKIAQVFTLHFLIFLENLTENVNI